MDSSSDTVRDDSGNTKASVTAVHSSHGHTMEKFRQLSIRLIEGLGVEGDAHSGSTVKHRSRVRRDPTQPNLRQVHMVHSELHEELRESGFNIAPGQMGENITTHGIDLLGLAKGTLLRIGQEAVVEVTGLRNPCVQLDGIAPGLMSALIVKEKSGRVIRKAGVMAVVRNGGEVRQGDPVVIEQPAGPFAPLEPV